MNRPISKDGRRHLLHDTRSQAYYLGKGEWTMDADEAKSFADVNEIKAIARCCGLLNAEIVEQADDGGPDKYIPIEETQLPTREGEGQPNAASCPGGRHNGHRSKTTGELIEEIERERDAVKMELARAQETIKSLKQRLWLAEGCQKPELALHR